MNSRLPHLNVHTAALMLGLLLSALPMRPALGQEEVRITTEGFDELAASSTLYLTVPMDGVIGVDCPAKGVHHALSAAAKNKHISDAVFMINSERGWLIQHEHVGAFQNQLEITAVVRNAVAPAVFPAFFADTIFMVEDGLIGGLPISQYVPKGSEEVTAKQVGILSSMLASAAQSRGHAEAIAYSMIDEKKDLFYWREDGEAVLSNTKPSNTQSLEDFEQITSAVPSLTLLIDRKTAIQIGLAKPIDAFNPLIVGEYLGKENWLPANQFGRVCNEIGHVIAELEELRTLIRDVDKLFPDIKVDRGNRNDEDEGFKAFKRNMDRAVDVLDTITDALEALYESHPERHAYFAGQGGTTILEDADQWDSDVSESIRNYGMALSRLRKLTSDFDTIGGDGEYLYDVNQRMKIIGEHLQGIRRYGNAAYWAEHAQPDLPDDIYG